MQSIFCYRGVILCFMLQTSFNKSHQKNRDGVDCLGITAGREGTGLGNAVLSSCDLWASLDDDGYEYVTHERHAEVVE